MGRYGLASQGEVEADMRDGMDRIWRTVLDLEKVVHLGVEDVGVNGKRNVDIV